MLIMRYLYGLAAMARTIKTSSIKCANAKEALDISELWTQSKIQLQSNIT